MEEEEDVVVVAIVAVVVVVVVVVSRARWPGLGGYAWGCCWVWADAGVRP